MDKYLVYCLLFLFSFSQAQNIVTVKKSEAIEDIEFMVKSIESVHFSPYEDLSKPDFYKMKDSIVASWIGEEIPLRVFVSSAMKLAAKVSGGNTSVEWQNAKLFPELGSYGFLPFKMRREDGKVEVTYTTTEEAKRGDIIRTINGKDVNIFFDDINNYTGGLDAVVTSYAENFIPLYLFLNGIQAPYFIEKEDGDIGYVGVGLSLVDASLLLTSHLPKELFSLKFHKNDIALLTLNTCNDVDTFQTFIADAFKTIHEKGITNLIIDIRNNESSDDRLNRILLPYITNKKYRLQSGRYWKVSPEMKERFADSIYIDAFGQKFADKFIASDDQTTIKDLDKKRIKPEKKEHLFEGLSCVLIGSGTRGSAADLADAIKTYEISALLGKPTGEMTNAYGEYIEMKMPNTETYFFIPSTYELGADGDVDRSSPVSPDEILEERPIQAARDWLMKH